MYSNSIAKFGRFKSNCMTEGKRPRGPALLGWDDLCHSSVWVSRGLNLNLSSVGGRSLKLTDYYRAEARRYLPDRAKTEAETMRQSRGRGSKVETRKDRGKTVWGGGEAEPAKKNCLEGASSRGRCLEDFIPGNEGQKTSYWWHCSDINVLRSNFAHKFRNHKKI